MFRGHLPMGVSSSVLMCQQISSTIPHDFGPEVASATAGVQQLPVRWQPTGSDGKMLSGLKPEVGGSINKHWLV
jgi:hypothetical protein